MSQKRAKPKKKDVPERLRIGCVECLRTIVVPCDMSLLQMSLWKGGKWVLTGEAIRPTATSTPIFRGELSVLCPDCQDKYMDPELLLAAREIFAKRYDGDL